MMISYGSIEAGPITASNYLQMDAWFHLAQVVQKCSGLHFERWILKLLDLHSNRPTWWQCSCRLQRSMWGRLAQSDWNIVIKCVYCHV